MGFVKRTHDCGELRLEQNGDTVSLNGWAHKVRDLGGVLFIDMRDRTGLIQLTFDPSSYTERPDIKTESCISVTGTVKERAEATKNLKMPTGEIEIEVSGFTVLNSAKPLPFPLSDEDQMNSVNEELRIKHRYLDLRRPSMLNRLIVRAAMIREMRAFLDAKTFIETETPIITKSTPEGARDYLVPYRNEPGLWYALPQSPQQYKQLLMVSGLERYYQVAKCFRDESMRSDRQPEFTQLDIEVSFMTQDEILSLTEDLMRTVGNKIIADFNLPKDPIEAFARMTYAEAMEKYGCDKPDLRFGLEIFDLSKTVEESTFSVFKNTVESGGHVRGVKYPNGAKLSRKEITVLEDFCKDLGAKGMAWFSVAEPIGEEEGYVSKSGLKVRGSIVKFFQPDEIEAILEKAGAVAGDLMCFIADGYEACNSVLYRLRLEIGDRCGLRDSRKLAYGWVVDFPLVEWDATNGRWSAMHHPFTSPIDEDLAVLETKTKSVRANAYDMVCNGNETAGGSIRIHDSSLQQRIFTLLGIDAATQQERFGHLIEAFSFGAPPHGGIAFGIDRAVMIFTDTENIREVIAFPKIGGGQDPLMDAPSTIDAQQWAELGLSRSK